MKQFIKTIVLVAALLLIAAPVSAAQTKIFTSRSAGFSLKYPASWESDPFGQTNSFFPETSDRYGHNLSVWVIQAHQGDDWTSFSPAMTKALQKKNWTTFVNLFIKANTTNPTDHIPDSTIHFSGTGTNGKFVALPYGLNGYTASIVVIYDTIGRQYQGAGAYVLVTKDFKKVYMLESGVAWKYGEHPSAPLPYEVRALFQSFRII